MASSNIKLFDENKGNMLSDSEFSISNQRMNGLQTGVASSQLQNKAMYQASLVAYAIAQVMMQNGLNANDTDAVSTFVANLSGTMLQKVYDLATKAEAQAGVATGKWMSPALVKAAIDTLAAKAQNILSDTTKALYGLDSSAVPDDVFVEIIRQLSENVNPNLLDNWYFGNPVDQRQGYVVPPGTPYFQSDYSTQIGTTDKYYTLNVLGYNSGRAYGTINVNGVTGYVGDQYSVRGYASAGYGIDRWMLTGDPHITLVDNKIIYENTDINYASFKQRVENPNQYIGKTLTFSVLARAISGNPSTFIPYHGTAPLKNELSVVSQTFVYGSASGENTSELSVEVWSNGAASSFELFAAKLELGDTQTLAHQDADGNWVLNEIPNYGQELLKCCMSTADPSDTYANNIRTAKAIGGSKIAKGSYTGTGSYGSGSRNSLTFDFEPKIVIVQKANQGSDLLFSRLIMIQGMSSANNGNSANNDNYHVTLNFSGNTVSWYSSDSIGQLNFASTVYEYVALG